jgi:hypothetical protein
MNFIEEIDQWLAEGHPQYLLDVACAIEREFNVTCYLENNGSPDAVVRVGNDEFSVAYGGNHEASFWVYGPPDEYGNCPEIEWPNDGEGLFCTLRHLMDPRCMCGCSGSRCR